MTITDIALLALFAPILAYWMWTDWQFRKEMDRWAEEDEATRQRIREREGW